MLPGMVTQRQRPGGRAAGRRAWPPPRGQLRRPGARAGPARGAAHASRAPSRSCCMDEDHVIGVRDPHGFRPLCLGKLDNGWVLASETPGPRRRRRPLRPRARAGRDGHHRRATGPLGAAVPRRAGRPQAVPVRVRLLRPARHQLYGQSVHRARVRMGELLAEQAPVEADLVMGVPESGMPAAEGYARRSGIPYGQGLVKNRYIGRTFIAPNQAMRALGVRMKLNPLRENIAGKRLVVRRRLDRAGHHHPGHGEHAARGRRGRGPPAHLVAALPVALLLRHGHRHPGRAASPPT